MNREEIKKEILKSINGWQFLTTYQISESCKINWYRANEILTEMAFVDKPATIEKITGKGKIYWKKIT